MKILITGTSGFVGSNLVANLSRKAKQKNYTILTYGKENSFEQLEKRVIDADFIFHLAAQNRPKNAEDFFSTNVGLTKRIVEIVENNNKKTPIVFSSSLGALQNNDYGLSKTKAEQILKQYSKNAKVYIYRLPNLFGKWSKPNYNSVVATWCYNISRKIPIQIDDKNAKITLAYIDDVVEKFCENLENFSNKQTDFDCKIETTTTISLAQLSEKIFDLQKSRETLVIPNLETRFDKQLYATFFSSIPKYISTPTAYNDERGTLCELFKSKSFGQIFVSKTKPGVKRGGHGHDTKAEKFVVISGKAKISTQHFVSKQKQEFLVCGDCFQIVEIVPGFSHEIENVGQTELITIFYANEIFEKQNPDTYNYGFIE